MVLYKGCNSEQKNAVTWELSHIQVVAKVTLLMLHTLPTTHTPGRLPPNPWADTHRALSVRRPPA
eukprot:5629005-Prymnesium_polylepis.1